MNVMNNDPQTNGGQEYEIAMQELTAQLAEVEAM